MEGRQLEEGLAGADAPETLKQNYADPAPRRAPAIADPRLNLDWSNHGRQ